MFSRVDLYTHIHNGLRGLLFDLSRTAACADARRAEAIDTLVARVDRALGFLDEHASHEDRVLLPVLRRLAPELEARLTEDHRGLDQLQEQVRAAALELELAEPPAQPDRLARLATLINQLTAAHLGHMHREETEANRALWAELADDDLLALRTQVLDAIPPARLVQWSELAAA